MNVKQCEMGMLWPKQSSFSCICDESRFSNGYNVASMQSTQDLITVCQDNYAENSDICQTFFCCCKSSLFLGITPLTTSRVCKGISLFHLHVLEYENFDPIFGHKSATNIILSKLHTCISLHILFGWSWSGSNDLMHT